MNCATPDVAHLDLRDFYFEALPPDDSRRVHAHLAQCAPCAAELDRLQAAALALRALPDEEIPRRIAFVSDKVFEPSPAARWFQQLWLSGARLASVAALVLAGAILVHAFRPVPAPRLTPATALAATPAAAPVDRALLQAAVNRAVAQAVGAVEARYDAKLQRVIAEDRKQKRDTMERVATVLDSMDRRNRVLTVASNSLTESGQ